MTLSDGFKLAIIEAYYENGRSLIAAKRSLMSKSSQWGAVARNLSNQQILRVVKQFPTQQTLKIHHRVAGQKRSFRTRTLNASRENLD